MAKASIREKVSQKIASRKYSFMLVFRPAGSGHQVTVPLLPGLITCERTLAEAREMARDAIRCHVVGQQRAAERLDEFNLR